jgi:hypothetical protein
MPRHTNQDDATLLAEMRARVEAATSQIDGLTAELTAREGWIDELESIVDAALAHLATPLLVVGDDRRIRALSQGASDRFGGDVVVGKPLSSVVADDVFTVVDARLVAVAQGVNTDDETPASGTSGVIEVLPLAGGGAIVVFEAG